MTLIAPNYIYKVTKVNKIVDGDTIDVTIDLGLNIFIVKRLRLLNIDTDERRRGTSDQKKRAKMATNRISELVSSGNVFIRTKMDTTGKYGRLLATIYVELDNGSIMNVNKTLVSEGYEKGNTGFSFSKNLILE